MNLGWLGWMNFSRRALEKTGDHMNVPVDVASLVQQPAQVAGLRGSRRRRRWDRYRAFGRRRGIMRDNRWTLSTWWILTTSEGSGPTPLPHQLKTPRAPLILNGFQTGVAASPVCQFAGLMTRTSMTPPAPAALAALCSTGKERLMTACPAGHTASWRATWATPTTARTSCLCIPRPER